MRHGAEKVLPGVSKQTSRMNTSQFTQLGNKWLDKTAHVFFLAHLGSTRDEAKTEALRQWSSFQTNFKSAWANCLSLPPPCSLPPTLLKWSLRVGAGRVSSAG